MLLMGRTKQLNVPSKFHQEVKLYMKMIYTSELDGVIQMESQIGQSKAFCLCHFSVMLVRTHKSAAATKFWACNPTAREQGFGVPRSPRSSRI